MQTEVDLKASIMRCSRALGDGAVFSPLDYAHFASRATLYRAFDRLIELGEIVRLKPGSYVVKLADDGMRD